MNALRLVAVLSVTLSAVEVCKANSYPAYGDPTSSPSCGYAAAEPCYGQPASPYCGCVPYCAPPTPPPYFQIPYSPIGPCQELGVSAPFPSRCPAPCAPQPPPPCPCPVPCPPSQVSCPSPFAPQSSCSAPSGATASYSPSLLNVYKYITRLAPSCSPATPCRPALCPPRRYKFTPPPIPKFIPVPLRPFPRKAPRPCAAASPPCPCKSAYELSLSPFACNPSAFSQFDDGPSSVQCA